MLLAPLLLQSKGLSRRISQFILELLYLIVLAVLKLTSGEQEHLARNLSTLPRTTDHLYPLLQLDSSHTGYICCPKCFALYEPRTLLPLKAPFDLVGHTSLPPPLPRPGSKGMQVLCCIFLLNFISSRRYTIE